MERFLGLLLAGGLALVAGLWLLALGPGGPAIRTVGWALALAGTAGLAAGIWTELDLAGHD